MGDILDMKEWGERVRRKRLPVREQLMRLQIERGNTVSMKSSGSADFPAHLRSEMTHWLGMPKPPAPSVSNLGPIPEDYFPPLF